MTPRMAGLRPGTSPPPVRMPMMPFLVFTLAMCEPLRWIRTDNFTPSEWETGEKVKCIENVVALRRRTLWLEIKQKVKVRRCFAPDADGLDSG